MASLSSLGVGSGLDAETIVTQLVALEKKPATDLTSLNSKLETKVSTWGKIQSTFSALQDAAGKLTDASFWNATKGSSSDDTSVSVSTSSKAAPGSYSVNVTQLAKEQYIASKAFAAKTDPVGEGTLRIELGTYSVNNNVAPPAVTFNAKVAATAVDISIGPGDNTLEKIRDRINTANAGITASIVNDASGSRLVMRGQSGEENAFKVSVTESGAPGLSELAYDASTGGTTKMSRTQSAQNAVATINGLSVSSSTNTLNDVVDGVTLQLKKVTTSAANLTIEQDTTSITKGVNDFISSYNSVVSTIRTQTLYDEASKTAGPLQGDATARGLLSQVRSLVGSSTTASSVFSRLSDIGIDINKDGTLAMKSAKFNEAMKNPSELQKFFGNSNETDANNNGMAQRIRNMTKLLLGSDGAISSRTDGIKSTIERNKDQIERIDKRVSLVEARLRAQYTALDNSIAKLNGLSSYVSAQLAALSKNS